MEVNLPSIPSLREDLAADVCIVGGGIAGLTCAYTLVKHGKSVVLLDKGDIGFGQTARTTAHLTWILNDRYSDLESYFGLEGAKLAALSHASAIDYIEKIVQEEGIDCDFERVDGHLFLGSNDSSETLDKEYKTLKKMGKNVTRSKNELVFPNQAQFHILKYLKGLLEAIVRLGGKIYNQTHVTSISEGFVKTESGNTVQATSIIVATATPINDRVIIHTKQAPYRTYVIAALVPKNSITKGLYWDTEDPYHYVRTHPYDLHNDWLIVGGKDHKVGQEEDPNNRYDQLEKWARKRYTCDKIQSKWSGQVFNTMDALGFIGKNPLDKNIYIATGDSGNGITHGTIAGILIPDLIQGHRNQWASLYDPSRKTLKCTLTYVKENINTLIQYEDWLTPGDKIKMDEMALESGMILRKGLKKLAIYKDQSGKIHINSAVCPHLGACVRWNAAEKSWDCPCHGSRFDGCGKVITGPANNDLS